MSQKSSKRVLTFTIHLIGWGLMFTAPLVFAPSSVSWTFARYIGFCGTPIAFILVFYINYFVLIDRFLFRRRPGWFILYNLLMIMLLVVGLHLWHEFYMNYIAPDGPPDKGHKAPWPFYVFIIRDAVSMGLTAGLSVAIKMTASWYRTEAEKQEIEKERTQAELKHLKSQLNPHFLFNTLNNIYALVTVNPTQAQYAVHSLSSLLRYVLYDNNASVMPLSKEFSFMKSYIELMSLRLPSRVKLSVSIPDDDGGHQVAPLLFITLIENAFKHGISPTGESFINVQVKISEGNTLICTIENSYYPKDDSDRSGSGIGLDNLRKRLNLIYPNGHILRTEQLGNTFVSQLIINL